MDPKKYVYVEKHVLTDEPVTFWCQLVDKWESELNDTLLINQQFYMISNSHKSYSWKVTDSPKLFSILLQ